MVALPNPHVAEASVYTSDHIREQSSAHARPAAEFHRSLGNRNDARTAHDCVYYSTLKNYLAAQQPIVEHSIITVFDYPRIFSLFVFISPAEMLR
jgi:hypothetical protein